MKIFWSLFIARSKEYLRDRGSLFFSFVMPPFLIMVMAFAFSNEKPIFQVGVIESSVQYPQPLTQFLEQPFIEIISYSNTPQAVKKVQFHQLDMLIKLDNHHLVYWVNPESMKSSAIESLANVFFTQLPIKRKAINGKAIRYVDWVIPGILAMNLMFSGLFGIGFVIVRYRKNNVLKRLRATPMSAWHFLSAQLVSRLCIMTAVSVLIFTVSNAILDLMVIGSYWLLLLVTLIGNLSILSIALIIASRMKSEEFANGLLNLIAIPMLLLSEAWFPLDTAPEWVNQVSQFFPLTHIIHAARSIMLEGATLTSISYELTLLSIISLVCCTIAVKLFRWN